LTFSIWGLIPFKKFRALIYVLEKEIILTWEEAQ
jgi:hypothetical protein